MARAALVIGNSNYERMSRLRTPPLDAHVITSFAKSVGFGTRTLYNASERTFSLEVQRFLDGLRQGDTALFWFSGHGINLQGKDLLLPVDADPAIPDPAYAGFSVDEFVRRLTAIGLEAAIVVVDACREVPTLRSATATPGMRGLSFTPADATGMIVVYSAGLGESALDDLGQSDEAANSVFARRMLHYLRDPGLSLGEAFYKARDEVIAIARSRNHRQTPAIYDQLRAPLYLFDRNLRPVDGNRVDRSGGPSRPERLVDPPNAVVQLAYGGSVNGGAISRFEAKEALSTNASASAIAFLWSNWEVLFSMMPKVFKARRIGDSEWSATGYGGSGQWKLLESRVGLNDGRFEFQSKGRFLGMPVQGRSTFTYHRVGRSNVFFYEASGACELPAFLRMLRPVVRMTADRVGTVMAEIGGKAAASITDNPGLLDGHADPVQQRQFADMLAEEVQLLRNKSIVRRFFGEDNDTYEEQEFDVDPSSWVRNELDQLRASLSTNEAKRAVVDLGAALNLFHSKPRRALADLHALLERIVRDVLERQTGEPQRSAALRTLVRRLVQTGMVPAHIEELIRSVTRLADIGFDGTETVNFPAFRASINAMIAIIDWYDQVRA